MKQPAPTRRTALMTLATAALGLGTAGTSADDFANALRKGGVVVLLRHATTTTGVGDPPEFKLEQCSTQRNLSVEGRVQAQNIGAWFKRQKLRPSAVKSSAWCRCKDTADLAFGSHQVWTALNSTFNTSRICRTRKGPTHKETRCTNSTSTAKPTTSMPKTKCPCCG